MPVSRRRFLIVGQSLLAAAALPMKFFGAASVSSFDSSKDANLASFTKEDFQPLVNTSFAVHSGTLTPAWFTLLSVEDLNAPKGTKANSGKLSSTTLAQLDTFALHFQGTGESLTQGTYEMEHRSLGKFSLFVVPSGTSTYVAVVSHLLSGAPIQPPQRIMRSPRLAGVPVRLESL